MNKVEQCQCGAGGCVVDLVTGESNCGMGAKPIPPKARKKRSSPVVMGEDLSTFIQLASGHWVGINLKGYFATSVAYPVGQSPNRFKYEPFRKASKAEVKEYSALWEEYRALVKEEYKMCACGFTRIDYCNGDGPRCNT